MSITLEKEALIINDQQLLINELTRLARESNYVFRGYSLSRHLNPTLIRNNSVGYEHELLYEFERYSSHYLNATNPIDLMSNAQHFGLPTRLIDFTYNPFIALYFSMFDEKCGNEIIDDDNNYYYIRYASLDDNICIYEFPQKIATYFTRREHITPFPAGMNRLISADCDDWSEWFRKYFDNPDVDFRHFDADKSNFTLSLLDSENIIGLADSRQENINKIKRKPILFFDPTQSNQRLIMQQGLFMYPYTLVESEHRMIIERNTTLIRIHKDLRNDMRTYLNRIGINAFRLMPDLASICDEIKRQVAAKHGKNNLAGEI